MIYVLVKTSIIIAASMTLCFRFCWWYRPGEVSHGADSASKDLTPNECAVQTDFT